MTPIDKLKSVLCDPEGKCCIHGSDEDRRIVDEAITALQAIIEQPAPVPEGSVSKGEFNRMRDDYNDLVNRSEQDAKDATRWRKHVKYCQFQGVDLDYQITTPPAAQPAQKPWVNLTDEEIKEAVRGAGMSFTLPDFKVARAIEAKLKEKNHG